MSGGGGPVRLGTWKLRRGFALALARKHKVVVWSSDPDKASATASKTGAAGGATYADAGAAADMVILTVWQAMDQTLDQLGDLPGRVLIDVSYPYTKHEREALRGTSTAEVVQKRLPKARVFMGWNHVYARHLMDPAVDGIAPSVLITGDDPQGKDIVFAMARDMGFRRWTPAHSKRPAKSRSS